MTYCNVLLKRAILILLLISMSLSVHANPIEGPGDMMFYSPPIIAIGAPGELVWYRDANIDIGNGAPDFDAWNVLYHSTNSLGNHNKVTGTVIIPNKAWRGRGGRPVISYAVGTHGLDQRCAPSIQMSYGTDYENVNIREALKKGYAVLVTDNPGYTNGDVPTYLVGGSQARAALDIVKAATEIPGVDIDADSRVAIWGYSQGGQTAAWAGGIHHEYAPNVNLVAIASGGTPADFIDTAHYLNGSIGASFILSAVIGIGEQYPTMLSLPDLLNSEGVDVVDLTKNQCVFESLFEFMNQDTQYFTIDNMDLSTVLAEVPSVKNALQLQDIVGDISVPIYQYHGQADEFIPLEQHYKLKKHYCEKSDDVTFALYPSEHIVTQFQAAPHVLSWLGDRFAGKTMKGSCNVANVDPVSTANPGGGDFVVSLDEWELDASIKLKRLRQTVNLPKDSTFSADTNMTSKTLSGDMKIPEFFTKLWIGLPLDIKLAVIPAEAVSGEASLDDEGMLHLHGKAYADIQVTSAGISFFQIPFGCRTRNPAEFSLDLDGPVSMLGSGDLKFEGTTEFEPMRHCGFFNGLFTALMSGTGQKYTFNVLPPNPVVY